MFSNFNGKMGLPYLLVNNNGAKEHLTQKRVVEQFEHGLGSLRPDGGGRAD